jgi:hypothetical protein
VGAPRDNTVALGGEVGWNTLAGLGGNVMFNVSPYFSIDAGLGLSAMGWKAGGRLRVNFVDAPVTPFVASGILVASGASGVENTAQGNTIVYDIKPSSFGQVTGGIDIVTDSRWTFTLTGGYAVLLGSENVVVTEGTPNRVQSRVFNLLYNSGIVVGLCIGRIVH